MTPAAGEREPIAITGIGCRFPGGVVDAAGFWRLVADGVDAITEIPADRIELSRWFDARPATPGKMMTRWGGFLDRIEEFDPAAFGISPREAERLDPQQRLLLETAWEALEDAGEDFAALEGSRTGVFVGQWLSDFESRLFAEPAGVDFYMTTGSGRYAASGRLSYLFGLRGPSLTIDTACSSSLTAVHLAVQSIRSGESDLALAGGVNVILQPHISIAYSQSRMMAPDGHCKFGDAAGDGYVRSEGAGIVVLKPLARALADGDRIYGVVRGSAVNNDGRSSGSLGTPSQLGQEELLRSAYGDAGVSPGNVGYVEAHGTGTSVGDPVELGALGAVLGEGRGAAQRGAVGSVKTNVGHTEGAAGIAGLIKATLALHNGAVPPSLHFAKPNPTVRWSDLPLSIPTALRAWPREATPRVAGVSAFGIAGTNAHVVLEEAPLVAPRSQGEDTRPLQLLVISARSAVALRALASRHVRSLAAADGPSLRDVCWSAATRRTRLEYRAAFVAADRAAMADALRQYAEGAPAAAEGEGLTSVAKIAFVCPGQGAQWVGMARELMGREPAFRAALDRCDQAARAYTDWSIVEQLNTERGSAVWRLDDIDVIQPVLVALSIAYAGLWKSLGVEPGAVVGHSMGEVAAAHIGGVLDLDSAMRIVCRRSALMRRVSGRGAMLLAELTMDEAAARIAGREDRLSVAVSNSPRSTVISGDPDAVHEVQAELEREQRFCRLVKVDVASHSPQMEPLAAELAAALAGLAPALARVPVYSTVLGRRAEGAEFDASYWARNLRRPVLFTDAVTALSGDGFNVFVELGPHPVLLPSVEQTVQSLGRDCVTLGCGIRDEPEQAAILATLGGLWCAGVAVDWARVMPGRGSVVPLPLYPWQRERHWVDAAEIGATHAGGSEAQAKPDDESMGWLYRLQWTAAEPPVQVGEGVRGPWLVLAAGAADREAIVAALQERGAEARAVESGATSAGDATGASGATGAPDATDAIEAAIRDAKPTPAAIVVFAPDDASAPFLPLRALQAVMAGKAALRPRLWFVTRGGQAVTASGERVSADLGALWGAARVVAEEQPEAWDGLVDVDAAGIGAPLAHHLLAADGEDQAAIRGGKRFVLRLAQATPTGKPFTWRPDAAYLITGGLGDVGLHVAKAMAARGARRLVLMGRTPLPPRQSWTSASHDNATAARIAAVRALEASGVAVQLAAVDVGDEAQLRAFFAGYTAEAWPPIRGVVHAAGVFGNELAVGQSREAFDAVLRAKLRGAQLLDQLLPDLDLFVLFSSTGAFLVQPGQASYAAANAGLDALAADRRARGLPALSIAWGVWEDTGLVKNEAGRRNVAEMNRQGIQSFTPERGGALFGWLCGRADASIAVLPVDWSAFRRVRAGRDFRLFRDQLSGTAGDAHDAPALDARLAAMGAQERRQLLEGVVRETVGKVLKIAPARLDPRKALGTMGLNSLMAMELRNRLEAALGRSLSATLAWNYPTIEALAAHLAGGAAVPPVSAAVVSAAVETPAEVAGMSDDDALKALRAARPRAKR